jgi:hypothetical protein
MNMRAHWVFVSLASLCVLVFTAGCGSRSYRRYDPNMVFAPATRPSSGVYSEKAARKRRPSLKRTGWFHIVKADKERPVIGYMEECTHPFEEDKKVNIVYDKFLKKVGFVTPHGVVYRYRDDGSSKRMGLVPSKGVQGFLLKESGPVDFVSPIREKEQEGDLVMPDVKKEAPAPVPEE